MGRWDGNDGNDACEDPGQQATMMQGASRLRELRVLRCGTRIPGWRSETGVDDSSEASGRVEWTNDSGNYSHGLPNIRHGRYRAGNNGFQVPLLCRAATRTGLGEDKRRERMTAENHGQEPRMEKQQNGGGRENRWACQNRQCRNSI